MQVPVARWDWQILRYKAAFLGFRRAGFFGGNAWVFTPWILVVNGEKEMDFRMESWNIHEYTISCCFLAFFSAVGISYPTNIDFFEQGYSV